MPSVSLLALAVASITSIGAGLDCDAEEIVADIDAGQCSG